MILIGLLLLLACGCKNPFAPDVNYDGFSTGTGLSDLKTPEGVFTNMRYAYSFKDTLIYGELLSSDFLFTYRDYENGFDVSWSRQEEMKTAHGLFTNTDRLDLVWNNIVLSTIDSTTANIIRGFNLTITFNPSDVIRIDGRVNMGLKKNHETGKWQISSWIDESNY